MGTANFRSKTRKEVAFEYGITVRTLHRWLRKENLSIPSGIIKPIHLNLIYLKFGLPQSPNI